MRTEFDALVGGVAPDRLALAAVAYLTLPGLLFVAGWLTPWLALPAALAGAGALALSPGWRGGWPLARGAALGCALGGVAWGMLATGTHHWLYAAVDWQIRDAVLRDLAGGGWPVSYAIGDITWLLRAPLGYYLVPAMASGAPLAALFLWNALGLALVLALLAALARQMAPGRRGAVALVVAVFIGFGGMDLIPNFWLDATEGPGIAAYWGRGGEWWARRFQYSGHATLLLWAPNHALPAWIAALVLLRHGRTPGFARGVALPLAAGCFWGPISAAGAAVLAVMALARGGLLRVALAAPGNWLSAVFALPLMLYLTAGSGMIEHGFLPATGGEAATYARFLAVEVLAIAVPVLVLLRGWLVTGAVLLLALLPLYLFGPGNEMTMRGGIAPFAVLAVACAAALLHGPRRAWRRVLAGALAIGALGQGMEASILANRPWAPSRDCSLPEAAEQSVFTETDWSHYVITWPDPRLAWMLDWPEERVVRPEMMARCWPEAPRP